MLLTIDVGNTQTVLGVYDGANLVQMWRMGTDPQATADEVAARLAGLVGIAGIDPAAIDGVAADTVVPATKRLWKQVARGLFGTDALFADKDTAPDLLDVSAYAQTLGSDRIVDAIAARALYGAPAIVLDLGTATNIEVIGPDGRYRGGAIAPGLQTSMNALVSGTAQLPAIELVDPGSAIGTDTVQAIQIGVVYGEAARMDGLVARIERELGCTATVVATGGFCHLIGPLAERVDEVNPELTLQGLRIVYEHVRGGRKA